MGAQPNWNTLDSPYFLSNVHNQLARRLSSGGATMAGDSDSPDYLSSYNSNKRLKVITSPNPEIHGQLKSQENEKSLKSMEESHFQSCGICLMEEGKSIRGQIDSCYHYFCFVCIMEWSKIESRCPMCKRRFTTIRRPRKEGVFPYERIVNVPPRDQVYYHFGPADPYSHVQCSVCHSTSDDSLLLLCDLCDVAAHTYCVGLGYNVPEGDWFCHDCVFLRTEHNNADIDSDVDNQNVFGHSGAKHEKLGSEKNGGSQSIVENSECEHVITDIYETSEVVPPADASISIFDIVHEESDQALIWRPCPRASSSLRVVAEAVVSVVEESTMSDRRTSQNSVGNKTELGARTLHRCRNVRSHIQALRKNWRALQNGSLSFASCTVASGSHISKRCNGSEVVLHNKSSQRHSSTSQSCQQLRAWDDPSGDIIHSNNRSSHDIDKAWKMMEIARSLQQNGGRKSCVHLTSESKHPSMKGKASQQATTTSPGLHIVNGNQHGNNVLSITDTERQRKSYSLESKIENHRSPESQSQKLFKVMTVKPCEGLPTTHSRLFESSFPRNAQTRCGVKRVNGRNLMDDSTHGASSSVAKDQGSSSFSINLIESVTGTSNSSTSQRGLSTFRLKADNSMGKDELGKGCAKSKTRKDDDAKSEIQSLVKLNLKLLSREKQLGFDAFKEIARCATHTILAACGLEHSKSAIRFFPSSVVCSHTDHLQQIQKSNIMPNSCRECFYVFVKDVVQSIMYEK